MPYPNNYFQPFYNPSPQSQGLPGKIVNDFNEIMANDVPMNGSYAFFIKGDLSEVQARAWSPDGRIVSVPFKAVLPVKTNNLPSETKQADLGLSEDVTKAFMEQFEELKERLSSIEENFSKQSTTRRKKEGDSE
ncbi:MAG: hypothetical protein K6D96_01650 [Acetatifactor sp.]|nr:hypothetical protein [Acetatifactor sp.]